MYYLRKMSKTSNLWKIKDSSSIEEIPADVLKQELGTSRNTLSFWKSDSLSDLKDAILAILLSTTSIETSQFIILNDDILDRYGIKRDFNEKGITAYKGYEDLHVNLCELNYRKIGQMLSIIKEVSEEDSFLLKISRKDVKKYITEAKREGKIDEDNLRPELKVAIEKYCNV